MSYSDTGAIQQKSNWRFLLEFIAYKNIPSKLSLLNCRFDHAIFVGQSGSIEVSRLYFCALFEVLRRTALSEKLSFFNFILSFFVFELSFWKSYLVKLLQSLRKPEFSLQNTWVFSWNLSFFPTGVLAQMHKKSLVTHCLAVCFPLCFTSTLSGKTETTINDVASVTILICFVQYWNKFTCVHLECVLYASLQQTMQQHI